jgi:hypothetical protein
MQFGQLKRRELITLLGAATAYPMAARAPRRQFVFEVPQGQRHDGEP